MIKKRIELEFLDKANKKFKIFLDDPKEDLEEIDILNAMDLILEKNIFTSNNTDLLEKNLARIWETTISTMEF